MTYQKATGSLMASGYDKLGTQEVMSDMYIVENNRPIDGEQPPWKLLRTGCVQRYACDGEKE